MIREKEKEFDNETMQWIVFAIRIKENDLMKKWRNTSHLKEEGKGKKSERMDEDRSNETKNEGGAMLKVVKILAIIIYNSKWTGLFGQVFFRPAHNFSMILNFTDVQIIEAL